MKPLAPINSSYRIAIDHSDVHVWLIHLDASSRIIRFLTNILLGDEQERMARFVFEKDRRRFAVAHAALRLILAQYLDCQPSAIRFSQGVNGKPYLSLGTHALFFNLCHSDELALLGITRDGEIGIDLEHVDRQIEVLEVADQFFTPTEVAAIRAAGPEQQQLRFLEFWTRKEAYLKALGHGLSVPLNQFDVSTLEAGAGEGRDGRIGRLASGWSIRQFNPAARYVAALASRTEPKRVITRTWSGETTLYTRGGS